MCVIIRLIENPICMNERMILLLVAPVFGLYIWAFKLSPTSVVRCNYQITPLLFIANRLIVRQDS